MTPKVDSQQDYELISLKEESGKTIMKIKRKFDTCDSEDNKIEVSGLSHLFFPLFLIPDQENQVLHLEALMLLSRRNTGLCV